MIFSRRRVARTLAGAVLLDRSGLVAHIDKALAARRNGSGAAPRGYLTSLTLLNGATATQQAGVPTQTFGWIFKDGDIPAGTAPIFSANGVAQPFSTGLQTYWPSGCLKFASFMLLPTFGITGRGARAITISRGDKWPAASARTLTEVYAQNLVVNAPPFKSAHNGRASGRLSAWLNGDGNTYRVVKWLDGAAGTGWRISTHLAQSPGATKDGMLVVDHYIIALNDGSGGLGGFRWMGALRQPFYNQNGQLHNSPGTFVFFRPPSTSAPASGVNWQTIGPKDAGTITTPLIWLGSDGKTFDVAEFSYDNGTKVLKTTTRNNYYMGAGGPQTLPVVFAGSSLPSAGNVPSGVAADIKDGGFTFLATDNSDPQKFSLHFTGLCGGFDTLQLTSSGSGTIIPVPGLWPFNRLMFAASDGKYNFFQGSGSIAAETSLRVQIEQKYWQSSGVIPPFNLTVNGGAFGGVITEQKFPYAWFPYSIGPMPQYQPGVGDHPDIGILPWCCVQDFYNLTANTERMTRIVGLSSAMALPDFKDAAGDKDLNLGNPGTGYGLPVGPNQITWNPSLLFSWNNFAIPAGGATAIGYSLSLPEHEPCYPVWAYLRTGELQYLDFIAAQAQGAVLSNYSRNAATPSSAGTAKTYYAVAGYPSSEMRILAWANRDMQWAAHLYPRDPSGNANSPVFSDGTQLGQYLTDLADELADWPWDQFQNCPAINSNRWAKSTGNWLPWTSYLNGGKPGFGINCPEWEYADFCLAMCLAVARGNKSARSFIQTCHAGPWNNFLSALKGNSLNAGFCLYTDDRRVIYPMRATNSDGNYASALITSNDQLYAGGGGNMFVNVPPGGFNGTWIIWRPNNIDGRYRGPAFAQAGPTGNGYVLANGDRFSPSWESWGTSFYPAALEVDKPYWAINTTPSAGGGATFDLCAAAPGQPGDKIPVLINDRTPTAYPGRFNFRFRPATPPMTGCDWTLIYAANFHAAACWATALGIPGFGSLEDQRTLLGDIQYRLTHTLNGGVARQGWFYLSGRGPVNSRYCYQPNFA